MIGQVFRRLALAMPTALGAVVLVFLMLHLAPGDPARLLAGPEAPEEVIRQIRDSLGLDHSLPYQLARYVERVSRGDLGISLQTRRAVLAELREFFPNTVALAFWGTALAVAVGIPAGAVAASAGVRGVDRTVVSVCTLGASLPTFITGIALIYLFAFYWPVLPPGGRRGFASYVLPVGTVAATQVALVARLSRSALLQALREDYVRTARAKGQREWLIVAKHALRNALIPVVTGIGLQLAFLVGGLVVTESVFNWPGVGQLMVQAIVQRDYPVVQGGVLIIALSVVVINLVTDLLVAYLDPRLRE
jgi:peptide/nickel transport system permease protein